MDNVDPFANGGSQVVDHLAKFYTQKFKNRRQREKAYWEDPDENFIQKIESVQEQYHSFCN